MNSKRCLNSFVSTINNVTPLTHSWPKLSVRERQHNMADKKYKDSYGNPYERLKKIKERGIVIFFPFERLTGMSFLIKTFLP